MTRSRTGWALALATLLTLLCILGAPAAQAMTEGETWQALNAVTSDDYPEADAVVVLDETTVEVEETGLSHVYKTQLIKVLTEAGAAQYATMRFDYDPASSLAEVQGITVYRKGGEAQELPPSRIYDLPQPQAWIYWGPRMKVASIPKLQPGDAVEIRTYSKGFVIAYLGQDDDEKYIPPMRGHYYDVVLFQGDLPMVRKVYTIHLPKDKPIIAKVFNGGLASSTSFDQDSLTYSFWKEDVPAVEREERMVEDSDTLPKLVLATVQDWPEKSRWFFKVNEDFGAFDWNDAIMAKVREITKGLKTDEDKRFALLAWVARQIRYSGISMGKGEGYTLHPGIMTFNDRAGVCKDIAGMLITMLRAAGYTVYPAMTMAGARVEDIPADQFNHCVVAVETGKDEYTLYDPTWCPFSREIWSSAEKPQHYVIGTPRGEVLMSTPEADPADNFIQVVSTGRIDPQGNLRGKLLVTAGHYSETNLRWGIVYHEASETRSVFEKWVAAISPAASLLSFKTTDVLDVGRPFRITLEYEVPGYAMVSADRMILTPPAAHNVLDNRRLLDWASAVDTDTRTYDIFLRAPREFRFTETITLPSGYRLESAPSLEAVDGDVAAFSAHQELKGNKLRLEETFVVKKKIIPADQYANLKQAAEAFLDFGDALTVLAR